MAYGLPSKEDLMSFSFGILKNESDNSHVEWEKSCKSRIVRFQTFEITKNGWLPELMADDSACYLSRPPGSISFFKNLYDERLYILHKVLGKKIYPTYEEILIYENKKFLSYWLTANQIPHPRTWVFYHKSEALQFAETCPLPLVGKTSIGASGSGVRVIKSKIELIRYIDQIYSDKGIQRAFGPNLRKGKTISRISNVLKDIPGYLKKVNNRYQAARIDPHRWFVILQEFIPCDFEWRAVKIGRSYFAHKKLPVGEMCSGTTKVSWDGPSRKLLDFVEFVCEKRGFYSQAVDIFETQAGQFLVNEMQAFFGSENPHQMIIKGKPGRYIRENQEWIFEEGYFNTNNSYDLRLDHALRLLEEKKL
jgi:glutathione synthase/RimK-type ligase-like ATP-grasp enzyme